MGAYMYPININREPQKINIEIEVNLGYNCDLTLADLKSYGVKDNSHFNIYHDGSKYILSINNKRLETKKELKLRVEKEESYMLKYNGFHKINK